jgi:hypothetical protein
MIRVGKLSQRCWTLDYVMSGFRPVAERESRSFVREAPPRYERGDVWLSGWAYRTLGP